MGKVAKFVRIAAFAYVVIIGAFAFINFTVLGSLFLTYGLNQSTATLLSWSVISIVIAIPVVAVLRVSLLRGRALVNGAVLVLPLITWGTKQLPADFDAVTGVALKYCAERLHGGLSR